MAKANPKAWFPGHIANGQRKSLGMFANFEDAVKARESAEEKYHGEYRRG